ncbi:uncharacterized protein BKA55DRAFT_693904 [Fusarium redolens]|uniref:Uncharacterized protein n=1 Tax=Fusarium redolens TaxID=48865 RepID=A0A9P9GIV9_FUSRE|nr:uncharacterized protein BKA55DRAFT_693904 [Fusarium redolens]KAH7240364.1 hypothetical protein BKA55DRAFT_693904 [Fusarium redolens]
MQQFLPDEGIGRSLPVYKDCLRAAVGEDYFQALSDSFALDEHPDVDATTASLTSKFAGSLSAKIGVLLDYSIVSAAEDYSETSHQIPDRDNEIPWQLRGSGFDPSDILVWTYNFMPFTTLEESRPMRLSPYSPGDGSHRALVEASHVKIVLLCGPRAEQAIRREFQNLIKSELQLRYNFTLYFDNNYPRLFIRCPELPSRPSAVPYHHNSKIGEALRFAAKMTGVESSRTAFLETSTVIQYILCQIKAERLGTATPMTTQTIPEGVKFWLLHRGFRGLDDISQLEKLSGTLSRGLLVVLHGRAKLAREGKIRHNSFWRRLRLKLGKQEVRVHEPFDPEMYPLARAFYSKLAALSDKEVLKSCTLDATDTEVISNDHHGEENDEDEPTAIIDCSSELQSSLSEEPDMKDLAATVDPAIIASITNGDNYPLADIFKAENRWNTLSGQQRCSGVSNWKKEGERYKVTPYRYILPESTRYKHRRISVGNCRVLFDIDLEVKDSVVDVWIEISPPNNTHPNHYATYALPKDPATRLAFLVVYKDDNTYQEVKAYAFFHGYSAVCRANTLVDRIDEGKEDEDIVLTPRRYLDVSQVKAIKNSAFGGIVGGGFTDDLLGLDREGDDGDEEEDEDEG